MKPHIRFTHDNPYNFVNVHYGVDGLGLYIGLNMALKAIRLWGETGKVYRIWEIWEIME